MPLTHPQAEYAARMICGLRPDFPRPPVISMLISEKLIGYSDLQILSAAFDLASKREIKTIQPLPEHLEKLYGDWGGRTQEREQLSAAFPLHQHPAPQAPRPAEPKKHLHPVTRAESCPIHEGGLKSNCSGCRADALAATPTESENDDD